MSPTFDFIGLQNFQNLTQDSLFLHAVRNNLVLLVAMPLAVILLALFYAFLLNGRGEPGVGVRGVRGSGFYKLAFFLPQVLSVPVIAVIWAVILDPTPTGLANSALRRVGFGGSSWLADPNLALYCVLWVLVGQCRVLSGAVQRRHVLDPQGHLRGGGDRRGRRVATFFRVTIPLLWDTIQTSWVYLAILALDVYALVAVMTPGRVDRPTPPR